MQAKPPKHPLSATPTTPVSIKPTTYTVKSGDYLTKIANATGVSVSALKTLNNLSSDTIHPGQVLKLSKSVFMNPAEGRLTSNFGSRTLNGDTRDHLGIDVAKAGDVPIHAAYEGTIVKAEKHSSWGSLRRITDRRVLR